MYQVDMVKIDAARQQEFRLPMLPGAIPGAEVCLLTLEAGEADFTLVSICADASIDDCRRTVTNNMFDCNVVCDGEMLNSRLFRTLAFSYIPDNIVVKNGRVVARNLNMEELKKQLTPGKTQ